MAGWGKAARDCPEHSFRTAALAYFLAIQEGANAEHTAILALLHDATEARLGDIESVGKRYLDKADEDKVAWDQISGAPLPVVEAYTSIISEFRERAGHRKRGSRTTRTNSSPRAQAVKYAAHGYARARDWVNASRDRWRARAGGRWQPPCAMAGDPDRWWVDFVANYRSAGTANGSL